MGLAARTHEDCDALSATDLLDSYLEKQLTGVTDHVYPPPPTETPMHAPTRHLLGERTGSLTNRVSAFPSTSSAASLEEMSLSKSINVQPLLSESCVNAIVSRVSEDSHDRQAVADDELIYREKMEDLWSRCRMMNRDLNPCEKLEYESEDLLKKLERLKETCRRVIGWERHPVHPSYCPSSILRSEGDAVGHQRAHSDGRPAYICAQTELDTMSSCFGTNADRPVVERSGKGDRLDCLKRQVKDDVARLKLEKYLNFEWERDGTQAYVQSQSLSVPSICCLSGNEDSQGSLLMAEDIRRKYPDLFKCMDHINSSAIDQSKV